MVNRDDPDVWLQSLRSSKNFSKPHLVLQHGIFSFETEEVAGAWAVGFTAVDGAGIGFNNANIGAMGQGWRDEW